MRLRKSAVTKRTIGGTERHSELMQRKARLGSVRLAHLIALYHWEPLMKAELGVGEAAKILGVPA